jgi:hypothetical protein
MKQLDNPILGSPKSAFICVVPKIQLTVSPVGGGSGCGFNRLRRVLSLLL